MHPIDKGDVPLDTYHIDHVGPMVNTQKRYKHILVVIDAFSKFVWLYPTRSTDTAEVINRLTNQASIFGNPRRIISDRGTAFTSNDFQEYCNDRYLVEKVGEHEGPQRTSTSADHMKQWDMGLENIDPEVDEDHGDDI